MKNRKIWLFASLIIALISSFLLISGNALLTKSIWNNVYFPFGTLTTWLGFIGLSFSVYCGIKELRKPTNFFTKLLSYQLKVALVLSFLWIFISYVLAGNFSFTFTETNTFQGGQLAMKIFWILCYTLVIIPILVFFSYHILKTLRPKT